MMRRTCGLLAAVLIVFPNIALAQDELSESSLRAADEAQRRQVAESDLEGVAQMAHPNRSGIAAPVGVPLG
jgi:hypothetical protein